MKKKILNILIISTFLTIIIYVLFKPSKIVEKYFIQNNESPQPVQISKPILITKTIKTSESKKKNEISIENSQSNYLCIILTSKNTLFQRGVVIWNTWAKNCNQTVYALNSTGLEANTIDKAKFLKTITLLELPIKENYDLMADKVLTTIRLVYEKYSYKYKWFLLVDDDTFIYTNNLHKFILAHDFNLPLTYGYNFKTVVPTGYHSGGGGTLITHESLKRLYNSIKANKCMEKNGYGDVALGLCSAVAQVKLGDSIDSLGRERFHCLGPWDHYGGNFPDWLFDYATNKVKKGVDCCSTESISFHYVTSEEMNRMSKSDNYLDFIEGKV